MSASTPRTCTYSRPSVSCAKRAISARSAHAVPAKTRPRIRTPSLYERSQSSRSIQPCVHFFARRTSVFIIGNEVRRSLPAGRPDPRRRPGYPTGRASALPVPERPGRERLLPRHTQTPPRSPRMSIPALAEQATSRARPPETLRSGIRRAPRRSAAHRRHGLPPRGRCRSPGRTPRSSRGTT